MRVEPMPAKRPKAAILRGKGGSEPPRRSPQPSSRLPDFVRNYGHG